MNALYKKGNPPMRLNLNVYGSPYTFGLLPEGARKWSAAQLLEEAVRCGLQGVEIPTSMLNTHDEKQLDRLRCIARELNLEMILSTEGTDGAFLKRTLEAAATLGCTVLRTVVGGANLGGDRRSYLGRWKSFLETVRTNLTKTARHAERWEIPIAIENHQDLSSEELLWLCETIDSPFVGVTFDTANALGVAELPLEFAQRVAPYIRYTHLKDYRIYSSESGYRLVRCPAGQGVVPFEDLIGLLKRHGRAESGSVELGALEARHVRLFEPDFWPEYPARSADQVTKVMKFVLTHGQAAGEDFRTPHERGASKEEVMQYEESEWKASIDYLKRLTKEGEKSDSVMTRSSDRLGMADVMRGKVRKV